MAAPRPACPDATSLRFDGEIVGVGTAAGVRIVVGMWASSPFGAFVDAMVERGDGHRILVAPTAEIAGFVRTTYTFDEVRIEPTVLVHGAGVRGLVSPSLEIRLDTAGRTLVGSLLRLVPARVATSRAWCAVLDPLARRMRPGVRTRGSAGQRRREWYAARDEHRVTAVQASLDGADLGGLRPVWPPVRFGFGSAPRRPAVVRVTTLIDLP